MLRNMLVSMSHQNEFEMIIAYIFLNKLIPKITILYSSLLSLIKIKKYYLVIDF